MKRFVSFSMLVALAVFVMSSCNSSSDNEPKEEEPTKTEEKGITYVFSCNDAWKDAIKSVEVVYTMPGEAEVTEAIFFVANSKTGYYDATFQQYTTRTGAYSAKLRITLNDVVEMGEEEVSLYYKISKGTGIKGCIVELSDTNFMKANDKANYKNLLISLVNGISKYSVLSGTF